MSNTADNSHNYNLLSRYRSNLYHLLYQAASFGGISSSTISIATQIKSTRIEIDRIKNILRSNNLPVIDDDNEIISLNGQSLTDVFNSNQYFIEIQKLHAEIRECKTKIDIQKEQISNLNRNINELQTNIKLKDDQIISFKIEIKQIKLDLESNTNRRRFWMSIVAFLSCWSFVFILLHWRNTYNLRVSSDYSSALNAHIATLELKEQGNSNGPLLASIEQSLDDIIKEHANEPKIAYAWFARGYLNHYVLGDMTAANRDYTRALNLSSQLPIARYHLATLHISDGNNASALPLLNDLITQFPDDSRLFNQRGFLHLETANLTGAENDLIEGIRLNPQSPFLHKNLGVLALKKRDYPRSTQESISAIMLTEDERVPIEARRNLIEAYLALDDTLGACNIADELKRWVPGHLAINPLPKEVLYSC